MPCARQLFGLLPDSWFGQRIRAGKIEIVRPKKALAWECEAGKGEVIPDFLRDVLREESQRIGALPDKGSAIRCDKAERIYAREFQINARKTVDVCIATAKGLLFVECKYKARPDTSIVQSVDDFNNQVAEKFRSTRGIWASQSDKPLRSESVVLFNSDSFEKVLSMFLRLRLEDDERQLFSDFRIMNTAVFSSFIVEDLV